MLFKKPSFWFDAIYSRENVSRLFSFHFFLSCVIFSQLSYLLFFFLSLICQYKFLNICCLSLTLLSFSPFDNFSFMCFYLLSKSLSFCFSLCFYLSCVEYLSIYYLCLFIFLFSLSVLASLFLSRSFDRDSSRDWSGKPFPGLGSSTLYFESFWKTATINLTRCSNTF